MIRLLGHLQHFGKAFFVHAGIAEHALADGVRVADLHFRQVLVDLVGRFLEGRRRPGVVGHNSIERQGSEDIDEKVAATSFVDVVWEFRGNTENTRTHPTTSLNMYPSFSSDTPNPLLSLAL
jgi:hypothetical protein